MQCDIDTVGTSNALSDAEILAIISDSFEALGFKDFSILINDRNVFKDLPVKAIIAIDKGIMEEVKNKKIENRAEVRGLRNRNEVEYKKVLTEQQYNKYEELKEERKEKREGRRK